MTSMKLRLTPRRVFQLARQTRRDRDCVRFAEPGAFSNIIDERRSDDDAIDVAALDGVADLLGFAKAETGRKSAFGFRL